MFLYGITSYIVYIKKLLFCQISFKMDPFFHLFITNETLFGAACLCVGSRKFLIDSEHINMVFSSSALKFKKNEIFPACLLPMIKV